MSHHVKLFALSTCIHCKNAKKFLDENSVPYDCVFVDSLSGDERKETIAEVKKHNSAASFPTLVIDGGDRVIVGFRKDEIKEALAL
ncbi:MAG: glutaredoxin family protein [Desulfovibrio sp.]|nr:MAG: glutaredoxin family protein [Desulfovibrio sp.]